MSETRALASRVSPAIWGVRIRPGGALSLPCRMSASRPASGRRQARLGLEHVQRRAAQPAGAQGLGQGGLVDDAAARY